MQQDDILLVDDLSRAFGGVQAVDHCSFAILRGSISALIGPNGAGKTTLVNLVAGALKSQGGRVIFNGTDITGRRGHHIAQLGLIRTFQISREFGGMTVLENMLVTPPRQEGERLINVLFRPHIGQMEDKKHVERALELLDTFGLYPQVDEYARNLSGGQKRLLELARAVMAEPELLLLDEPLAGVNPVLIDRIASHIVDLNRAGITFLLVEHNLDVVEQVCDHVVVMAVGRTLATGRMDELRQNEEVIRAYLGGTLDERAAG